MIKLSTVKNFKLHRSLKDVLVQSSNRDNKLGMLISVLTPSMRSQFEYYNELSPIFKFRFTERMVVEKLTKLLFHPAVKVRVFNTPDVLTSQLPERKEYNLARIRKFIVYNEAAGKAPDLKKFNTLYDINHAMDIFYGNARDKRVPYKKGIDLVKTLKLYLRTKLESPIFVDHTDRILFLPINHWVDPSNYRKTNYFKVNNPDWFSVLMTQFRDPSVFFDTFEGWTKIILTNYNEFMILDIAEMKRDRESDKPELRTFFDYVSYFMKLCKSRKGKLVEEDDGNGVVGPVNQEVVPDDGDPTTTSPEELEDAYSNIESPEVLEVPKEERKEEDMEIYAVTKAEEVLTNMGVDPQNVNKKDFDAITKAIYTDYSITDPENPEKLEEFKKDIRASMSDLSPASIKRNKILAEKYKESKIKLSSGKSVNVDSSFLEEKETPKLEPVEIKANLVNESLKEIKSENLVKQYMDKYYYEHLLMILHHFGKCDPPLFMISDLEQKDVSDKMNRLYEYSCTFEDTRRKRYNMKFLLPKMYQDRYLFINSSKKDIVYQKLPYPITKTGPDTSQVVTNDKKIFISRYGSSTTPKSTRLNKFLSGNVVRGLISFPGDATQDNSRYLLPLEFIELAGFFSMVKDQKYKVLFRVDDAVMEFGSFPKDENLTRFIPFAKNIETKTSYFIDVTNETVVDPTGREVASSAADFIIDHMISPYEDRIKTYKETSIGKKFIYSRATIMSYNVPVVLLLASINTFGLIGVMKRAGVKYEFSNKRPNVVRDSEGVIRFKDGYLTYDLYPFSNSLLMGGLSEIATQEYEFSDMLNENTYASIFEQLYNKRNLIKAFHNFNQTFIDPITVQIQNKIGGPTDFEGMVLMASEVLSDNSYKLESSYEQSRVRGPEIILSYLYKELSKAYGKYRVDPSSNPFTIPKDAVIKELMKSQSIDEHSAANVALELENDRRIKSKGPSGLNEDRAYTLDKRAFHPSMEGIVCLSTAVSGETGITRQLTINSNINDPLGFVTVNKDLDDMNGSEILGAAEMLNTFSIESADASRSMMTTGQSKHMITVNDMTEPLISTDFDRVAPYLSRDYSYVAKENGKVVDISNGVMIIKYSDGTNEDIDLSEVPMKHTNAGKFHMERLLPKVKKGQSFQKGDILAYNPNHFKTDMFGDLCAMTGTLSLVSFEGNGSTFEDSTYISETLAQRMATKATIKKDIVVNQFSNIKYYAKKGDNVVVNDYLLVFDTSDDEFTSQLLADEENMEDVHFGSTPVTSKVKGKVVDVKVYYTVDFNKLTPSMKKFIKDTTSGENGKVDTISKYLNIKDSNTVVSNNERTTPDSLGRIKGVEVNDGVLIEYYVEYYDVEGVADKITFNSAIKGTINTVNSKGLEPYTEEGEIVEATSSLIGTQKRMVLDIFKIGKGNKILVDAKKEFIKLFGKEIENFKA